MRQSMRLISICLATIVFVFVCASILAHANAGFRSPPPMNGPETTADRILVDKSERRLDLLKDGKVLASYEVSLSIAGDAGHKQREGDMRTPEGVYQIDSRNWASHFHLGLHVSYPNADDRAAAKAAGVDPGGDIMIHGMPNGLGWLGRFQLVLDWTAGCIAVTDEEIREIWASVPIGTPIEIVP
jgi:murein L,D-transpeptidase YafK